MNITQIAGHLGADPETRFTANGQKVTTIRVAANSKRGGKEETTWWRVTVWGDKFDKIMPYLKKGSAVIVIGEMIKPEIWTGKDGTPQVNLEIWAEVIRFSPFGKSERTEGQETVQNYAESGTGHGGSSKSFSGFSQGQGQSPQHEEEEEDLPF